MYLKINIFIIRFYNLIHHLTIWQRADDNGRVDHHAREQVYFTAPGPASVLLPEV